MKHTLQQEAARFCAGLRSRNEEAKMKAAAELKAFVATDLREHSSEDTKAFYEKINNEIHDMINNGDAVDKRGGILGIVCLLDVDAGRNLSRYTNDLSNILPCADVQLMEACARTMAHLGLQSGMTEYISRVLKRALNEWIRDERTEYYRHCATYVLREFALQTPTMFYQMVTNFFECIPCGLRDSKLVVREASALTVRAAFYVTAERETYRSGHKRKLPPIYLECLAEVLRASEDQGATGKRRPGGGRQTDEWWHGSLLLLNEMVVCCNPEHERLRAEMELGTVSGNFDLTSAMLGGSSSSTVAVSQPLPYPPGHPGNVVTSQRVPVGDSYACNLVIRDKYDLVWNVVLGHRNSRANFMVQTMLQIIPRLAALDPDGFRTKYFDRCMEFIVQCLRKDREKPLVFQAIGLIALCVGDAFQKHIPTIMPQIRNNLPAKDATNKKRNMALEASVFMCISLLAGALGRSLHDHFKEMLDGMLAGGLNPALTSALRHLALAIPPLKRAIQDGLLQMLRLVLMGRGGAGRGAGSLRTSASRDLGAASGPATALAACAAAAEGYDSHNVTLALKTLGNFDFEGHSLTGFLRHSAESFLSSEYKEVRLEAVRTCSYLLNPLLKSLGRTTGSKTALTTVSDVLNKIIVVGITDPDPEVRICVLQSLDERFDPHLAQAEHLQTLFAAVNDEVFANRESAMRVVGRLCSVNPACVQPSLRKCLLQLIRELEHSGASRNKEHAARLLTTMVAAAPKFIQAYAEPLTRTLLPKLQSEPVAETTSVLIAVTGCIGELAQVAGPALKPHVMSLFPLILNMMQDTSNMKKREIAVSTFGHLMSNTGFLMEPYKTRPDLLNILLGMLRAEQARSIRREVIRLFGLLGALDPFKYKIFTGEVDTVGDTGMAISLYESREKKEVDMSQSELLVNVQWNQLDEFFSACTMSAMMRMLRDPSLINHTMGIIQCIIFIFKALGPRSVTYLGQVMPDYLSVMRSADQQMRQFLYHQLGSIMAIVRVNIKAFMDEIVPIVLDSWRPDASRDLQIAIIVLLEHMVLALGPDIKPYLASFLPYFLRILNYESIENHRVTEKLLKSLEYFGPLLNEYYHILIPAITRILDTPEVKMEMRTSVLHTLEELCTQVDLSDLASRIVQPSLRCMERHTELQPYVMSLITTMLMRMGPRFMVFIPSITKVKNRLRINHAPFDVAFYRVTKGAQWLGARVNPPSDDLSQLKISSSVREKQQSVMEDDNKMVTLQKVSTFNLEKAWHYRGIVSKPDWTIWLRNIATSQLKESSNPALRACCSLATGYAPLAAELFNAAFVSVWYEFNDQQQDKIINTIENVMKTVDDMPEISQTLLNLAEFMEHCERGPLPLEISVLAERAIKIRAFAKALHYKEQEFLKQPTPEILESLISINNKLQQHEAAQGVLDYATKFFTLRNEEMYLEKLHDWSRALKIYNKKLEDERVRDDQNLILGRMRCLEGLGEWGQVNQIALEKWPVCGDDLCHKMAQMAAHSAWALSSWEDMKRFVDVIPRESCEGSFLRAVLSIHDNDFPTAHIFIEKARDILDTGLTAMAGESYSRAYGAMVYAQMLSELEEVMQYKLVPEKRDVLKSVWRTRLKGCQNVVEDWCKFLHIRSLVMTPQEDSKTWLKFVSLCQKTERENLSLHLITKLLGYNPEQVPVSEMRPESGNFEIIFSYTKHLWHCGRHTAARERLKHLAEHMYRQPPAADSERLHDHKVLMAKVFLKLGEFHENCIVAEDEDSLLKCRKAALSCYQSATETGPQLRRAWQSWALANYAMIDHYRHQLQRRKAAAGGGKGAEKSLAADFFDLGASVASTTAQPEAWMMAGGGSGSGSVGGAAEAGSPAEQERAREAMIETRLIETHCVPAVRGFVSSVMLTEKGSLQDILRLINLLFNYGYHKETREALRDGLNRIQLDNWLLVVQQLLARIDTTREHVSSLIVDLLINVGKEHPQALINPLILAFKSGGTDRRRYNANRILYSMEEHNPRLVSEGFLLNEELIRLAITWLEMWHECLEDASRVFFGEHDIKAMFALLQPLHELTDKGPETLKETAFHQEYIRELNEARECGERYQISEASKDIHQAWEIYYGLYRKLARQVPNVVMLELSYASPRLVAYGKDWELAVPGTYEPNKEVVKIKGIKETLHCITSKQRPRKLTLYGSNGQNYMFLLKGHEDIRQDERVMQFFGLANTLLMSSTETFRRNLTIQRMSVIPLSTNTGLIGWVPNSDTLHSLIRDYRECKKVLLNIEHRIMLRMSPDFERLTVMQKTEVLEHGLAQTVGDDLAKVLWIKSPNSEIWFDRRTNYIRSLATMSVVGYILGLGDRHPSNIMLDRETGKIIHIDFGDCFEVATMRDKFPEQVPFRLTRMLIKAMEVTGIDGTFRKICEMVMELMRANKESLLAVLEAFVYDPLLQWILLDNKREFGENRKTMKALRRQLNKQEGIEASLSLRNPAAVNPWTHHLVNGPWFGCYDESKRLRKRTESGSIVVERNGLNGFIFSAKQPINEEGGGEVEDSTNNKAVTVMQRVQAKLKGEDFKEAKHGLVKTVDSKTQVDLLIRDATSNQNLCQMYIGWCPFW